MTQPTGNVLGEALAEYKSYRIGVRVHDRLPHHITATYSISDREGRLIVAGVVAGGFNTTYEARQQGEVLAINWIDDAMA